MPELFCKYYNNESKNVNIIKYLTKNMKEKNIKKIK